MTRFLKAAISFILSAVFLLLIATIPVPSARAGDRPSISAKSAIVIEDKTGLTVYAKDADKMLGIASITKVMTALIALEKSEPEANVKITPEMTGAIGSSIYLKSGQEYKLIDLLYGLMLESGNDAAVAIACFVSGSVEKFVAEMNDKAVKLECINTHFSNPHGLSEDSHYSTARDMAIIAREALKNETFCTIVGTKYHNCNGQTWKNHNKLLWELEGCIGVKTGYTTDTGRTLISSAERGGLRFIVVTLGDPNDWSDHKALYDYAFASAKIIRLSEQPELQNLSVPMVFGKKTTVGAKVSENATVLTVNDSALEYKINLAKYVYPTIVRGQLAGNVEVYCEGVLLGQYPLFYKETVTRGLPVKE